MWSTNGKVLRIINRISKYVELLIILFYLCFWLFENVHKNIFRAPQNLIFRFELCLDFWTSMLSAVRFIWDLWDSQNHSISPAPAAVLDMARTSSPKPVNAACCMKWDRCLRWLVQKPPACKSNVLRTYNPKEKRLEEKSEEGKNEKDNKAVKACCTNRSSCFPPRYFSSPLFFAELEEDGLWPTK